MKVSSIRADYIAKAMVTKRIKPMNVDGKKLYQIGVPIHWGFKGISEDEGRTSQDAGQSAYPDGHRPQCLHPGIQGLPGEARESIRRAR